MAIKQKRPASAIGFGWLMCGFCFLSSLTAMAVEISRQNQMDNNSPLAQAINNGILMAKVELLLVESQQERVISPQHELKSGDKIRLRIQTSLDSDYELNMLDISGQDVTGSLLNGHTTVGTAFLLPPPTEGVLKLDSKPGIEWLQLVISTRDQDNRRQTTVRDAAVDRKSNEQHPHGKIGQIILRNVELKVTPLHQIQYDPIDHAIYFFLKQPVATDSTISLNLGLRHGD